MSWRMIAAGLMARPCPVGATGPAAGQEFPKGPVKIIIPFPPGGPTDTVGRLIAQKLQEIWGQPVLIDYKPGAGTAIGVDFVAKSAPDGQTFGMVNSSLAVNPFLRKTMPYQVKDLAMITQTRDPAAGRSWRGRMRRSTIWPELIAYAKKNPGKLTYGTPGAGSTTHLGAELLKREAGFDMLHVPYKGSAPAHTELMGGRIDIVVDPFLSVIPYVKAGKHEDDRDAGRSARGRLRLPDRSPRPCPAFRWTACSASSRRRDAEGRRREDPGRHREGARRPETRKRIEELGMEVVDHAARAVRGVDPERDEALVARDQRSQDRSRSDPAMSLHLEAPPSRLRRRGERHRPHAAAVAARTYGHQRRDERVRRARLARAAADRAAADRLREPPSARSTSASSGYSSGPNGSRTSA